MSMYGPPAVAGAGVTWIRLPPWSTGSPKQPAQRERLVGQLSSLVHVDSEVLVFFSAVADTEGVRDAAVADDVEDADFFCQPDRIPEGDGHGRQQNRQLFGARGDRGRQDVRHRQMHVVGAVVSDNTAMTAPRVSAHEHISMAAAYRSVAGVPPSGARMSNRRVNISAKSKLRCAHAERL